LSAILINKENVMTKSEQLEFVKNQLETIQNLSVFSTVAPQEIATNALMVLRKPTDYKLILGAAIPNRMIIIK